jgi:fructose-1,6-bisphosphatase I
MLVLSSGNGVNGFTLDTTAGEFVLTHPNIRVPPKGNIYSVNEGNSAFWYEPVTRYVDSVKNPPKGNPFSLRYVGRYLSPLSSHVRVHAHNHLTAYGCGVLRWC